MGAALCIQAAGQAEVPVYQVGRDLCTWSCHKVDYVKNISHNFAELEREKEKLCDKLSEIKEELDRNKLKMEMKPSCKTWPSKVEKLKGDIERLETNYQKIHAGKFFCGLCPFLDQLQLGKHIVKKTAEASSLKNDIDPTNVMCRKKPAPFIRRYASKTDDLASLHEHVEKLKEWLRNEDLKRICIWGPPGVGKTTIMENVPDVIGKSRGFHIIFWVSVGDRSVRDVQEELLMRLYIEAEEDTNDQRAEMISEELNDKKYLLFLDEVSSEINLKKMGIHCEHRHGKVVFACRHREDCGQANDYIKVLRLSNEDATTLFWKTVGSHLKDYRDIKKVASLIINECSGMPQMIKLIGNRLANENDAAIWRKTLWQLRQPSKEPIQELEEVYNTLKLECDNLDQIKRSCFLYLAIFPSGYELHKDYVIRVLEGRTVCQAH